MARRSATSQRLLSAADGSFRKLAATYRTDLPLLLKSMVILTGLFADVLSIDQKKY